MKNLLFCLLVLEMLTISACATLGQSGASYPDLELSNLNAAPAKLSPPDYSGGGKSPLMDNTYLNSQADYHFTMAETYSYEGQSARAIEEYKSTLIYDPKSVHVRLRLAAEYVRMGMLTEAVEQGEIAVEEDPGNIDAHMLLGGLYMGMKMFSQARDQFQAVLDKNPGQPEASIYIGAILAEDQKYDESIKYFEGLTKNTGFTEKEQAYYYIGRVRSQQGEDHYAEAEKAFNQALALKPEYPEAALALSMLLRAQGKDKQMEKLLASYQEKFGPQRDMAAQLTHYYMAQENFDKALEQLEYLDGFERDNLNIKIQIALILIEQKKFQAAAQNLEDVLQMAPDSDKVRYYLGAVYEELHKPQLAITHYEKIGPGSDYFAEAVVHEAQLLKMDGKLDQAVDVMEAAIKKQDDVPQLYAYYATLLDEQKQYSKAVKMLSAAVDRFPTNTQLRFFLGTMDDRVGDHDGSVDQMNKVLAQDKDHVQALNYLAYTYAEQGKKLDEAKELAAHALELQPNDGYILDTMGWVHFKSGDTQGAIKYLEAAFKARSDEAIIAEHLGDAYLRNQMWQKAQIMYQKAASLESDNVRHSQIEEKIANLQTQKQTPARAPASISEPSAQ